VVERCDVLAVGAHPDDVEIGCGGTLAVLAAAGFRVGILDLTAGELGTRADATVRAREAGAAAGILGVSWRSCLGLPDGALNAGDPNHQEAAVGALRSSAPRAVLIPHPDDPHPDHGQAHALLVRAAFVSGLARFRADLGAAHRPRLLLAYPGARQVFRPTLVVDISAHVGTKRRALGAYASQFDPAGGPATHLASGHFLAAVEGRDRASGNLVGCEFGEGLATVGAIAAGEVAWLFTGIGSQPPRQLRDEPGGVGR
jgi:bacillithiol biosynthesis deacetylase BshB1